MVEGHRVRGCLESYGGEHVDASMVGQRQDHEGVCLWLEGGCGNGASGMGNVAGLDGRGRAGAGEAYCGASIPCEV